MKPSIKEVLVYGAPLPLIVASLFVGPSDIVRAGDLFDWFIKSILHVRHDQSSEMIEAIAMDVRLPRILLSFLVGSALTVSGISFQALFRNPLVSPDILGLSAGAAFGAALALVFPLLPLQPSAFLFGLLAVGASYFLALTGRGVSTVSLILAGIIISGLFTALLTVVQFLADPFKLQTIVHWTMGNLHNASWSKVTSAVLPILVGMAWLFVMRWRLNVIALGDEETRAVGLNPEREKLMILLPATLAASASVAVAGIIGMVGLAIPHVVRMLMGPDNKKTLPVSIAFGGSFLLLVDDLSRSLMSFEVPIGIFTTLIGGPFFVYLLKTRHMLYREP
jgi:iron complex transport system permease protein